jgi:hypothetical protein
MNMSKLWHTDTIYKIIVTCVIFQGMIMEDEKNNNLESFFE